MEQRKSFLLRVDAELWKALEAWAQDELRSVNAQVEYVLREAVKRRFGARAFQKGKEESGKLKGES